MKIAVISDTHLSSKAIGLSAKLLEGIKGADMIVHAGDFTDIWVLDKLKSLCPDVRAVSGNMDYEDIKNILPEKQVFKAGAYKIGLAHGNGAPAKLVELLSEIFKADKPDIIIFGHSHTTFNEKKNGILFFNPGSPTDKVFSPYNSYGIIEIDDKKIGAKIIKI